MMMKAQASTRGLEETRTVGARSTRRSQDEAVRPPGRMIEEHAATIRGLAETRTLGASARVRWEHALPVETSDFKLAPPGAYRIGGGGDPLEEKDQRYQPIRVATLPVADIPQSKRRPLIEGQHSSLETEIIVLEETTKARNRELNAKLEAIEALLRVESEVRQSATRVVGKRFDTLLAEGVAADEAEFMSLMERCHGTLIPVPDEHIARVQHDVDVFVQETVPMVIDRQSGIVARKLQKARDTFDIENAKIKKREQKIVTKFDRHVARTVQSFEDERATREAKLTLLAKDVEDVERRDDRSEKIHAAAAHNSLLALENDLDVEAKKREHEDNTLLDSMLYAQQKLQTTILEAFGAEHAEQHDHQQQQQRAVAAAAAASSSL